MFKIITPTMFANKSSKRIFVILVSFLVIAPTLTAQNESYGTWTSIGVEKEYKKWDFGAETELRTIYYARLIERWSLGVNADYSLFKQLKVGAGYQLINSLVYDETKPDRYVKNYFFRNRFNVSATGKIKINDFTVTLRERLQLTQKEDRLQADGLIDDYKMNPELTWRNRLQLAYNIPNFKITPSFSVESFYALNNPDGNNFDNLRYLLAFDYKLNKRNVVELYGVMNSSLTSEDATGKYILGISYTYTLK